MPTDPVIIAGCPHGEVDPRCCLDCVETTPAGPTPAPVEAADSRPVQAQLPGWCPLCRLGIHVGEHVVHTSEDRWVHSDCVGGAR